MTEEFSFQAYLSISKKKFEIYLLDKKNLKNIYKEEFHLENDTEIIDYVLLSNFLDKNIFKIEKLIDNFLRSIVVIIENDQILNLSIGMKKQNNIFWIAFVNQLPVGYAKLKLNSESEFIESKDVCQLQKIYVLKDFLSMGIGFELQDALLNEARELGFKKVWLSVLNSNERAINFYKKTGFEEIGNHDFQIGKENFEFTAMLKTMA